tara:strand:- start:14057 stop:15493 length:1437 start_codon:yes stop_codon:yes gene_type:complete
MSNDYEKYLNNERIWKFYNDNKNIDFESSNVFLVELLEGIIDSINNKTNTNINSTILSMLSDNKDKMDNFNTELGNINENITKMNTDLTQNFIIQFMNLKKEYIEDIKQIIENNSLNNSEKIGTLLDKNNSHLIDKTNLLINDIIPKNSENFKEQFSIFHTKLSQETHKMLENINQENSLQSFISTFENKYNSMMQNIQQPLFTYITSSEERITQNLNTIKDTNATSMVSQGKLFNELDEFLNKYKGSSNKGKYGEQNLYNNLNLLYSTAEIKNTSGMKASGDFIMKRNEKPTILFENKEYDHNVNKDEVVKFIRDIDVQNMNGVFLSQYSGISFKQNFQIDIHKGNVLVYIHNTEYSPEKIKTAVDIIDSLSVKIQELNLDENNNISKEMLDDINEEYQNFINQRELLITVLKDFQKKMTTQIESLKLPALDKYLEPKYANVRQKGIMCNICNVFSASSKQSLSAHQRGCKKKNSIE